MSRRDGHFRVIGVGADGVRRQEFPRYSPVAARELRGEIAVFRLLLTMCFLWIGASAAIAQPIFSNPLSDAATYRAARGDLSPATYRLRYEVTTSRSREAPTVRELIIDVAGDWSVTRDGEQVTLRDYRLNRYFTLQADRFTTMNGLALITFRAMERENRSRMQDMLTRMGVQAPVFDDCDADSELGVAIPSGKPPSRIEWREESGVATLRCAGRDIGGFSPREGAAPPAAFWPTLFDAMTIHPALHKRARDSGLAPATLESRYRRGNGDEVRFAWKLIAAETVSINYPLLDAMRNVTAETLDRIIAPGAAQLAIDAVAGRAQGGAPTLQSWGEHLRSVSQRDGQAAVAMLAMPTFNMFPELETECGQTPSNAACGAIQALREVARSDPAPMALLEMAMAEQRNDSSATIAAMKRAQTSPLRDHPVLGASFALALMRFDRNALNQTRAANLPTDIAALQARAVMVLPYSPAYWTDIGDRYLAGYRTPDAFLLYDIANALPMPSAVAGNRALVAKRDLVTEIRNDFPNAALPR